MDKQYWLARNRSATAMANAATEGEARLIHLDLAGRYSIKAAHCPPFMTSAAAPASEGDHAALRPPNGEAERLAPPGRTFPAIPDPEKRS